MTFTCGGIGRRVVKEAVRKWEIKVKKLRSNVNLPGCGPVAIRRRRGAARTHPFMLQIDAQFPRSTEVRYARKPCATNLGCVSSPRFPGWPRVTARRSARIRLQIDVATCRRDYVRKVADGVHGPVTKGANNLFEGAPAAEII